MKNIVIDSSVVLKWYLPDEEHCEKALDILEAHVHGKLCLQAPALLEFEVANALVVAKRRGRVDDSAIMKALEGFTELDIELYPIWPLFGRVLHYTHRYGITAYDAAYVALAEELKTHVVTADRRLFNSTRKLKLVRWIGNFRV